MLLEQPGLGKSIFSFELSSFWLRNFRVLSFTRLAVAPYTFDTFRGSCDAGECAIVQAGFVRIDNTCKFMTGFFKQMFCDTDKRYSVVVEDDGRVCYAYLLLDGEIVADVWLYNSAETPNDIDRQSKGDLPFLNPSTYVDGSKKMESITNVDDIVAN